MSTDQIKAQRMKFLFISDPNTFVRVICGFSLRTCAMSICAIMLITEFVLFAELDMMYEDVSDPIIHAFVLQSLVGAVWLPTILGPIKEDFNWCHTCTLILEILTPIQVFLKYFIFIHLREHLPSDTNHYICYAFTFAVYFVIWFISVYVYYSYTKSLGLGLLPAEVEESNSSQDNASNIQMMNSSLMIQERSCIVLTNPNDMAFSRENQNATVNNATLPSGLAVPSGGYGKNWKVVENSIILI
jgi:hypothetical protein